MANIYLILCFFCYRPYRVDEPQHPRHTVGVNGEVLANDSSRLQEECNWGNYARGALYALNSRGKKVTQVRIFLGII